METSSTFTAFLDDLVLAAGVRNHVAAATATHPAGQVLVLNDATGRAVDFDPRQPAARPGPGRPKLGVTSREVTLLPRHWEWLSAQPGGASASLRRLIEDARRDPAHAARERRDAAYAAMSALAGDRPGFEDASRALFAGDTAAFEQRLAAWPPDIADYLRRLLA